MSKENIIGVKNLILGNNNVHLISSSFNHLMQIYIHDTFPFIYSSVNLTKRVGLKFGA